MPVITVQFIKDVVATPEQKRELVVKLTDTFVGILGEVVRPFVYCIIQETPQQEWAIAGVPMPDLEYLTGPKHQGVVDRANTLMREAIAAMKAQSQNGAAAASGSAASAGAASAATANDRADKIWRGEIAPAAPSPPRTAEEADRVWRGEATPPRSSATAHAEAHRRLFARWFDELWNKKNYAIAHELVHPDFTAHGAGGQDIKQGPEGVIGMVKAWHAAMPDGRMTMDDIITEGDLSTIRMTWRGRHTGPFGEIPASGNEIEVTSIGIDRVIDGRITEGWGELNMLGMLQQMGAIPTPDAPEAAPGGGTGGGGDQTGGPAKSSGGAQASRTPSPGGNGERTAPASPTQTMKAAVEARNKAAVLRMYDEVNRGNGDVMLEVLAPDFVSYGGASEDLYGARAFKELWERFSAGLSGLNFEVKHILADGDLVSVRGVQTGRHTGTFLGAPPTGKAVTWTGTAVFRFNSAGKIVERWQDLDMLGLLQQVGALPTAMAATG